MTKKFSDYIAGVKGAKAWYEDKLTLIAYNSANVSTSNLTKNSSNTYMNMLPLSTKGVYGGIFESNNGSTAIISAMGAVVNQTTGAITFGAPTNLHSIATSSGAMSTCHFGTCGMSAMNIGHHMNPVYTTTNKGWCYAATFNANGGVSYSGNSEAPMSMWPNADGDLIMGVSGGLVRGRRSSYNETNSQFMRSGNSHNPSSGATTYFDNSSVAANTSTNYCIPAVPQSRTAATRPGGILNYQTASGGRVVAVTATCDVGTEYAAIDLFGDDWISAVRGFELSNGSIIWYFPRTGARVLQSAAGALTRLTDVSTIMGMITTSVSSLRHFAPLGNNQWIAKVSGQGICHFKIDPTTYEITVIASLMTANNLGSNDFGTDTALSVDGSTNQFLIASRVSNGKITMTSYVNPFVAI